MSPLSPFGIVHPHAQVHNTPEGHVTRDYREGRGSLADLQFLAVDTSGAYMPASLVCLSTECDLVPMRQACMRRLQGWSPCRQPAAFRSAQRA